MMPLFFFFLRNSKHKSITSKSIPQTSYIQVKRKLSTQSNSILLEKTNFALRHDTQTLKNTHYNTVLHTDRDKFKTILQKPVISVACGTPQVFYSLI